MVKLSSGQKKYIRTIARTFCPHYIKSCPAYFLNDTVSVKWQGFKILEPYNEDFCPRYRVLAWLQFLVPKFAQGKFLCKPYREDFCPISRTFVLAIGFQLGSNFWCQNLPQTLQRGLLSFLQGPSLAPIFGAKIRFSLAPIFGAKIFYFYLHIFYLLILSVGKSTYYLHIFI